jgi:ComF family protein
MIISLYPYLGKYQKLLESFKFKKSLGTGHFLAEKVVEALKLFPPDKVKDAVLVPVPPRPGKIRKTGWDQIACLSKLLRQRKDAPKIVRCLKKKKTESQKKLDREDRKTNLKGRIFAKGKVPPNCILFDDVITTGSTIDACATALKQAGAEKVYGICLFYD